MGGILDQIFKKNEPEINQAIGFLEDEGRTDSYRTFSKELEKLRGERESEAKFGNILNKLQYIDYNSVPMEKSVDNMSINPNHPDLVAPETSQNPVIQQYNAYKKKFDETDETGNKVLKQQPVGFEEYLGYYPDLKAGLDENYYIKSTKKEPMTPEEYKIAAYRSAGLTDEDIMFYEQNKDKLKGRNSYNERVRNFINQSVPQVMSRVGKKGDMYAKMLQGQGEDMMLPESEQPKNPWDISIKDGKVIKLNKQTGQYNVTDIPEMNKKSDQKNWDVFIDEDGSVTGTKGNPYYGERVEGEGGKYKIEFRDNLNKQELDDFNASNDKRDKTGVYTPKVPGKKKGPGGFKKFSMSKMGVDEVKKIKPSDIGSKYKTVEQLEELQKNDEYLTEETRKAIEDYLASGPEPDYAGESDQSTVKYFEDYTIALDDAYEAEKSGQQPQGYYDNFKKSFMADLEKYRNYLSKEDYKYYYDNYK